ncbi:MAG TPA: small-conductance mechanosensitive ion channel [Candidatus Limnocylindria bacterium]|nr:small-conductance mechanosensitive ion channel [Candidatus Limnocylindria bacterium]
MPVAPVTDISQALLTSLAVFLAAIPAVVGALVLLVIGWIIAGIVGGLVARLLRAIRVDQLADRAGVTTFLRRANVRADAAGFIAGLAKWYIRLVFLLLAANAVGLTAVSGIVTSVLAFLPSLLVAMVILAVFGWLASTAKNVVTASLESAGMPNSGGIGALVFGAVIAFGIVAAADQLGIAQTVINTLFMGVVAALALAFGLAFGLGGREQAAEIWKDWRGHASSALVTGEPPIEAGAQQEGAELRRQRELASRSS